MTLVSDNFGPIYQSVVLDGSGAGGVSFQATGSNIRLTNIFFNVSSQSNQAVCTIYKGQIAIGNIVYNSNSGSTGGNAQGNVDLFDGETCYVVWTGGDAGATATATFSGGKIPFGEVKPSSLTGEAVIAAGDGSLVYPALKSPNYVAGVSGWKLDRLGDAEVNSATVRGSLIASGTGGTYIEIEGAFPVTGEPAISLYPGTDVDEPGYIYAADNGSGFTQLALVAPADTGFPRASIEIYGATTLQPTDKRVAIAADTTTFSGDVSISGTLTPTIVNIGYTEKSSAQNFTNTTTLANVTDMSFTAEANAKYLIVCRFAIGGPTAADVRLAWSVPAGALMARNILASNVGMTTNANSGLVNIRRGAATQQLAGTSGGTDNDFTGWWEDTILTTSATGGTVQLQGAQGTANATPTVFQAESYFTVQRIA